MNRPRRLTPERVDEHRPFLGIPVDVAALVRESILSRDGEWYHIEDRARVPEDLWLCIAIDHEERNAIQGFKFSRAGAAEIRTASGSRRVLHVDHEPVEFRFNDAHFRIQMASPDGAVQRDPPSEWILVGRRADMSVTLEWPASKERIEDYADEELHELWKRKRMEAGR